MSTANLTFSLIVNTIDRAGPLRTLLYALEQQSYSDFEVIVVVGPTHDDTLDVLAEWGNRVRVLHCPTANLSQSRNIGLRAASGDIVAYIDDDAVPSYHWLAQLARLFQDSELAGTGGKVYFVQPAKPFVQHHLGVASGLAEQIDSRVSWLADWPPPGIGRQWVARMMGTNMAYRRRDLLAIGGFDEFFQWVYDDSDVALQLVNAGKLVHPVKESVVYHAPASSRNRQIDTAVGNWWIQTKAAVYFCIKHGVQGGNNWRDVALRSLHLWHGHLLWYSHLRRAGKIGPALHWKMRLQEARGFTSGAYHGWRQLHRPVANTFQDTMSDTTQPLQPFQQADSVFFPPAVDPVNGRRPSITLPDPPLRLCLLSMAYPPDQYEGVGRLTNLMAQGLFEIGHTVHVITHGEKDTVAFYDGAYVHRIPNHHTRYERYRLFPRLYNVLNYSHSVYDKVRQLQVNDGIQLVDSPLWQIDGLVTAVAQELPVVVRLVTAAKQISDLQSERDTDARLLGEMEQSLIQRATHLLPNTQATFNAVRHVYGVSPAQGRYTIVPYGIVAAPDTAVRPFTPDNAPATLTVLYVGRLEKRKGIFDLFGAIPQVLTHFPNVRFVIVGADNSLQDGFQKQHGCDYATYFARTYPQCLPHVAFTGAVSDAELNAHYQQCDLFVAPSLYESFGLIYLEAMNYAKPVIGCRAGGIPEVVTDGETGLLVTPEAPAELAAAMLRLLRTPTLLREMGLAGRQRLLADFTHVAMARRFAAVYRQVIAAQLNSSSER